MKVWYSNRYCFLYRIDEIIDYILFKDNVTHLPILLKSGVDRYILILKNINFLKHFNRNITIENHSYGVSYYPSIKSSSIDFIALSSISSNNSLRYFISIKLMISINIYF